MNIFEKSENALKEKILSLNIEKINSNSISFKDKIVKIIFPQILIHYLNWNCSNDTSTYDRYTIPFEIGIYAKTLDNETGRKTVIEIASQISDALNNRSDSDLRAVFNSGWSVTGGEYTQGTMETGKLKGHVLSLAVIKFEGKTTKLWEI